jgi:hypothetical protein
LWRGPALAEFALEDFAREEVARLEEARIRAVEMKTDADLALGRHAELVGELQALVTGHPLRERSRGQLMLALYRSGRQGEALRTFQEGRRVLADELGVDPGPELAELEAVSDPAQVLQSLAAVLGIGDGASLGVGGEASRPIADKLTDYLREKELLVVLDNCEHLIEACAQITEQVLRSAPKVRFLATSRERLGVSGEALLRVPPLDVPGPQEASPEVAARSDAVRLFVDRASRRSRRLSTGAMSLRRHQSESSSGGWLSSPGASRWKRPSRCAGTGTCWNCSPTWWTSPWSFPLAVAPPVSGCSRRFAATPESACGNPERRSGFGVGTRNTFSGSPNRRNRCFAVPSKRCGCAGPKLITTISAPPSTGHCVAIRTLAFA